MRPTLVTAAIAFLASALCGPASAQVPPPAAMKTFAGSADVTALIAKARAEHKEGQPLISQPLVRLAPYQANLEYRTSAAGPVVHPAEAELMYVLSGTGVLTTGGALADPKPVAGGNISGSSIVGGAETPLAGGDFIFVPQNTPHQFTAVNGELVLMTFHVPRTGTP